MNMMDYFQVLFSPRKVMEAAIKKPNMGEAAANFAKGGALAGLVGGILGLILGLIGGTLLGGPVFGIIGIIIAVVIYAILAFLAGGIGAFIEFLLAKIVGGTGSLVDNATVLGQFFGQFLVIMSIISSVNLFVSVKLPSIEIVISIISLLVWLYYIYVLIVGSSIANRISMGRAAIAVLLPVIIILVIVLALVGPTVFTGLTGTPAPITY